MTLNPTVSSLSPLSNYINPKLSLSLSSIKGISKQKNEKEDESLQKRISINASQIDPSDYPQISVFFFSVVVLLLEMSVLWMVDKHIVTAVSWRFRFQTRHAPFFIFSLSMTLKLNPLGDVIFSSS